MSYYVGNTGNSEELFYGLQKPTEEKYGDYYIFVTGPYKSRGLAAKTHACITANFFSIWRDARGRIVRREKIKPRFYTSRPSGSPLNFTNQR